MLSLRFDIDTHRGLTRQTPPLLDLLERKQVSATFFCVMGPEANLAEIVRLRLLAPRDRKSPLSVTAKGGALSILGAALRPRMVGAAHPDEMLTIVAAGHELQPHGWSHIQWQRDIERIDVVEHLSLAMGALEDVLGHPPDGFASPGRTWNDAALAAFDAAGLLYAGDMAGEEPFRPSGHRHLQLPITLFETMAQMRSRGLSDAAIVDRYLDHVDAHDGYCCLYEHPDDLGPAELRILDQVISGILDRGIEPVTLREIALQAASA